jgi:hypothetical protein
MPSPGLSLPPDAIRIEDEVWKEAFSRREAPAGGRARREMQATARSEARAASGTVAVAPAVARPPAEAPPAAPITARFVGGPAPAAPPSPTARRTVTITGRGAERHLPRPVEPGRRPARRAHQRDGFRPDRVAMWAVFLCVLLLAVAIASPHG